MADDKKDNGVLWIVGLIVTAMIGAGAAVYTQSGKTSQANQQNLIDNLPAVIAELDVLKGEVSGLKAETLSRGEVDARFAALVERLAALEGQLTRRFNEVVQQPMDLIRDDVEENEGKVETMLERVASMEARIESLLASQP